jgi:hypothetical protein
MNLKPWITVYRVNRGYIVEIACQTLVFTNEEKDLMPAALNDLLQAGELLAGKKWCDADIGGPPTAAGGQSMSEAPRLETGPRGHGGGDRG